MASYRKRSGGWRVEVCKNGVRDSATFPTKVQASAWATQREAELLLLGGRSPAHTKASLFDAIERYKVEVSPTKAGVKWELLRLGYFSRELPFIGDQINKITQDQIAAWRDSRLKEVASPTARRELTLLSAVFETAKKEWRWCSTNPVREIRKPSDNRPRDRRISAVEEQLILDKLGYVEGAPPENLSQELAYAFLIAIETAMRQGEILGLTKENTHLENRFVFLEKTKNGDSRDVPLSKRAVDLIRVLLDSSASSTLFKIKSASADALFRKARGRAGITDLHFHDTRHEATTRLARKLDVLDLARMTGHRDPRSLMVYYNATATEVAGRLD